jgi:hypothetical protein
MKTICKKYYSKVYFEGIKLPIAQAIYDDDAGELKKWLSAWDMFFKASFYFTEKHLESFAALDISEALKEELYRAKPTEKLLPLRLEIRTVEQLPDLLKIVEFKKKLK